MFYPFIRYRSRCLQLLLAGLLFLLAAESAKTQDLDYRAQSLYIYKFTKFIYWPEDRSKGDFIIGVYGNSPLLEELKLMASIKKAGKDQNIVVREIDPDEDLSTYHIIYVPSSKSRQLREIRDQIGNKPVLIVAEREGMASRGATISFMIDNYEILKFEVNTSRLSQQNLDISDELIKLGYEL
jgi:hypothetical protein